MSKVTSERIAAIKGNFEHGEVITQDNLADLIDAIEEAAEAHQHTATGGDGSETGDAGPVVNLQHGTEAQKPANPEVGDVYLETDTSNLYACFSAGSWVEIVSGHKFTADLPAGMAAVHDIFGAERVVTGSPFQFWHELRYNDNSSKWASWTLAIPSWYQGGQLKAIVFWKAAATSGSVRWVIAHSDRAPGESWEDPVTEAKAVTSAAQDTTEYLNSAYIIWTTPPEPGDVMIVDLKREVEHEDDTMSGDARVLEILIQEQ